MKKAKSKRKGKLILLIVLYLLILMGLGTGLYLFYVDPNGSALYVQGLSGLAFSSFLNVSITIVVLMILFVISRRILIHHKDEKRSLRLLTTIICLLPGLVLGGFLLKDGILDLFSISNPRTVLLSNITFDQSQLNGATNYDVTGVDQDGHIQTFQLNRDTYKSLSSLEEDDMTLYGVVHILPHTQVVMDIEADTQLDQHEISRLLDISNLSEDWTTFQIQIRNDVFTLNDSLSTVLDQGWTIEQTEIEAQRHANLDAGHSLDLQLASQDGLQMSVTVENTTDQTIETTQATVVKMTLRPTATGMRIILPGGLVCGWSSQEAVHDLYGEPSSENDNMDTYAKDQFQFQFTYTDQGILDEIVLSKR